MIKRVDLLIGLPNCGQLEYATHLLNAVYSGYGQKIMILTDVQKDVNLRDAHEDVLIVIDPRMCDYETLLLVETSMYNLLERPEIVRTYFENNLDLALRTVTNSTDRDRITKLSEMYFTPLFVIRNDYNEQLN